ncbi:MAG: Glyoxalase family protein, partial [uncultured Solirubrobacteraceae bacterium]
GHAAPPRLRQPPRHRPAGVEGVLRQARFRVRSEVHRRRLRVHGRRGGRVLRDAARPDALRGLRGQARRRRPRDDPGAHLPLGRGPGGRRLLRRRGPRGRRVAREGADGHGLHVRPLVRRPRRPPLGGHVDGPEGRGAGPGRDGRPAGL